MRLRHCHLWTTGLLAISFLISGLTFAGVDFVSNDDLVKLARQQFNYYSEPDAAKRDAFDKFFLSVHEGRKAKFYPKGTPDYGDVVFEDASKGALWGGERTVRAEWIVWLCRDRDAVKMVHPLGIWIAGAKIDGEINLAWLKLDFPLSINHCYFNDTIILQGATIRSLYLADSIIADSHLYALRGDNLTTQGDISFQNCEVLGSVSLRNAKTTGKLSCSGTHFYLGVVQFGSWHLPSLDLSFSNIGTDADLVLIEANSTISFDNAEIKGTLDCGFAKLSVKGDPNDFYASGLPAFSGDSMKVSSNMSFERTVSRGTIIIARSNIGGNLNLRKVKIDYPTRQFKKAAGFKILDASLATIDGNVLVGGEFAGGGFVSFVASNIGGTFDLADSMFPQKSGLDLGDAKMRILSNDEKSWPQRTYLSLEGFAFNELGGLAVPKAETQIKWLRLQSRFVAQPFEQTATVLRNMGYEQESVKVSIAEKWDEGLDTVRSDLQVIAHASTHWQIARLIGAGLRSVFDVLWFFGFGWVIQYGYRPWNALFISIGFVLFGWMVFDRARRHFILTKKESSPLASGHRDRNFSAFIYSLETFVPLVKLGVAEDWRIEANTRAVNAFRFGHITIRYPGIFVLWYYRIHIIAGWIFTSLWVAAFTGILKH